MKKGLLIASIASVTAVSAGLAFAISANKGIRFEAAKADPETETVLYDKDHHGQDPVDYGGTTAKYEYDAASTGDGYVHSWLQLGDTSSDKWDAAPSNAYFTYTSSGTSQQFFLRFEVAGLAYLSWDVSYSDEVNETNQGRIQLSEHYESWGLKNTLHGSGLYNNGEHDFTSASTFIMNKVYYLQILIYNIPEGATITFNSATIKYAPEYCKSARGL